jgi:hypothetical protein
MTTEKERLQRLEATVAKLDRAMTLLVSGLVATLNCLDDEGMIDYGDDEEDEDLGNLPN